MAAKDLGNKFVCFKCSTKFYDLKKPDPICPKCGADQRESPALRPAPEGRRGRAAAPKAAVVEAVEPEAAETPEPAAEEEDIEDFEDDDVEVAAEEDEDV
jgi:uncharacterized protein (TIGR02300 family)